MDIFELAKELGRQIKEDEKMKQMEAAELAYKADTELQTTITEYNVQRKALVELHKLETDEESVNAGVDAKSLIADVERRINELYHKIMENKSYIAFNDAQDEVNALMNRVNQVIMFEITGEEQNGDGGCTGSCATCGGCH